MMLFGRKDKTKIPATGGSAPVESNATLKNSPGAIGVTATAATNATTATATAPTTSTNTSHHNHAITSATAAPTSLKITAIANHTNHTTAAGAATTTNSAAASELRRSKSSDSDDTNNSSTNHLPHSTKARRSSFHSDTSVSRMAAEAEAGRSFQVTAAAAAAANGREGRTTDETISDQASASEFSMDGGHYEVIEYDLHRGGNVAAAGMIGAGMASYRHQRDEDHPDHFYGVDEIDLTMEEWEKALLAIDEDSPAAAALRANATVHVSGVGKAARAVHMQSVRKLVKRATGATKSGVVKGKPPRLPPQVRSLSAGGTGVGLETIPEDRKAKAQQRRLEKERADQQHLQQNDDSYEEQEVFYDDDDAGDALDASGQPVDIPEGVVAGTVEASKKVLGQLDPHDLLRLLRWKRKKKGTRKATKSYVKGKVIDGEHELYTLSIAVMLGVRTSIARTNNELNNGPGKRWVRLQDFKHTDKYEFRPKGGGLTPPHQLSHTFKFKDYSPIVFAYLRRMYGVNEFDFLLSVCGNANFIEFVSNAKSGQFFFYSSNGRYMIKTMTNAESKFLRRILPLYFRHCAENPNTIMTRFFGMYRVKLYHLRRNVKFVIMNSVYYTDKPLQSFYDLKGSSLGRDAKPGEAVKKDNDLRRVLPHDALALQPTVRQAVRSQIESDCHFFQEIGVMDYSMLVGIHHIPPDQDKDLVRYGFIASKRDADISSRARTNSWTSPHDDGGGGGGPHPLMKPSSTMTGGKDTTDGVDVSQLPSSKDAVGASTLSSDDKRMLERPPLLHKRSRSEPSHHRHVSDSLGLLFADDGLEDDDGSYLQGSEKNPSPPSMSPFHEETERKKQATVERLYWPFHRCFDIHGNRRLIPERCVVCNGRPCNCDDDNLLLAGYNIPKFLKPLSDRKDGGLEMDTAGLKLPLKLKGPKGEEIVYEGKIFYMGIIDILQEFTSRKSVEAHYRSFQVGSLTASCVPPKDYGHRFVDFFDEYTQRITREERQLQSDSSIELDFGKVQQALSRD